MNKSASTPQNITHTSLLTYSTWLVAGVWLVFTGVELIYKTSNGDNSFFNYLFGAVRILIGIHTFKFAHLVAYKSNDPQISFLRAMTSILFTIMIVLPLLRFILETTAALFGTYQPGEPYRENATRIVFTAACYLFATLFADWWLRK
jgi:uncharacterized membrane protein